ncbi:MAG: N5-glutamine methyltransferase family protein [Acidimicrobiia bacterium]
MRRLRAIASDEGHFLALIEARLAGEPLQYLEGNVQFGPVEVLVDRRVLIPRPETEHLFDLVSKSVVGPSLIVDLCTGSGPLALALKAVFPTARVIGADISPDALEVARSNGSGVEWLEGDLFSALGPDVRGEIDLLVANPPYVSEAEWDSLPADVKREPRSALVAGPAGTELVQRILGELDSWLAPSGEAWIEIGEKQGWMAGEYPVELIQDQYGVDRYLRWT